MTWFKNLNSPESFGFLRGQATPFSIRLDTGEELYAWHILPIGVYYQHETTLVAEPSGFALDITSRSAFTLLRNDPDARLIIHMHGAAGTVGSGYRVPNYRALSAADPQKIHVLTFDYRGFGRTPGTPSERGLCLDAIGVVDWALNVARIPPSRIFIFGQSLGTAVSLAISEHFALQSPPITFAGTILVAPFVDVATLMATYRIGGSIPLVGPLARFPRIFKYLRTLIHDEWLSQDRIARYVHANEANHKSYRLTVIHAEDDYDIPFYHTEQLFWNAVNATMPQGISKDNFEAAKQRSKKDLGDAGTVVEWRTQNGVLREEVLKTGLHDVIMGNPVITLAVVRLMDTAAVAS
ncbi:hypothetical protein ACLMJK_006302 [Lecanora helva]